MTHFQTVFLAHTMAFCAVIQLSAEYYVYTKRKARRCANIKRAEEKLFKHILSQIG